MARPKSAAFVPEWRTRYGSTNPERVQNAVWQRAIAERLAGGQVRREVKMPAAVVARMNQSGQERIAPAWSAYRDSVPGPFWSWRRFGRTRTALADGRVVFIAGEHEDSYDADFCIYNDVIVKHPGGRIDIYLYPGDVFPPTDFHSATQLDNGDLLLIGALGYGDLRRPGTTQVLRLDTTTFAISPVATHGDGPGWLSRHSIERLDATRVLVFGGMVQAEDGYAPNSAMHTFDLATMTWATRPHGDQAIFPVSAGDYRKLKNPRFGTANPEIGDNAFWMEMIRKRWTASRARLHYGDTAPPEPQIRFSEETLEQSEDDLEYGTPEGDDFVERLRADIDRSKPERQRTDVVWTAQRLDVLNIALPDGRHLAIGGEVRDYGDDHADPWVYNDVIVTHPDGRVVIWTYPAEVFPPLRWPCGALHGEDVFIFGRVEHRPHEFREVVVRLDTRSGLIEPMPEAAPPDDVLFSPAYMTYEPRRVIFSSTFWTRARQPVGFAFDLAQRTWSGPFDYTPPKQADRDDDDDDDDDDEDG